MPPIPLRPLLLPAEPGRAVDLLLHELRTANNTGHAIAPVTDQAQAAALPRHVEGRTAVVLSTSGSTGTPKRTALTHTALRASAAATSARLGGPGDWLLCLPASFVAGFQVVHRAFAAGTVVHTLDSHRFDPAAFTASARTMPAGRRYTALVPTQVRRLLDDTGARAALAGFDTVLVGGAPLDPDTRARLETVVDTVETYGMTETGGGCVYDGIPLDGVQVRLVDDQIHIGGPVLSDGYLGADETETGRFYTRGNTRWFRTADRGRWEFGRLRVLGRTDDLINTGGVKIPATAVERALAGVPEIDTAVVMGLPDPEWGELVSAYLHLKPGASAPTLDDLKDRVRRQMGRAAVPKRFVFADSVPLLPNSKIDRLAVRARLMDAAVSARP
ncbi:AMP-dependent synthetase [Streptacidiphilus pinicola]|uniref:AMP-dependent synthetase n=1 Tax=Streptacidiphilus pinicola TaxID=2219663 RepID=A0A2X0KEL6_9ACTN|nr:AMP-binding protein [Streptacidiphilus pinicola]RAG85300.1 AMP-dependent synthetase [Streptacidiphilus pinicola]